MSAVVRPTDAARGGNNNSIIRAAPAAAAAHHCFTITPPLGSLGATDGHCSQIGLFFLSFPSQVNHIEGGVRLQSCSLLAYFLLILASFPRGHSRTNVVAPSRDTATDGGDERARAQVGGGGGAGGCGGGGAVVGWKRFFPGDLPTCAREHLDLRWPFDGWWMRNSILKGIEREMSPTCILSF